MNSLRNRRGFTLIELMVVLFILGLLATLVAPKMLGRMGESKVKAAKAQIELLGTALDSFHLDVGRYPTSQEGLQALRTAPAGVDAWEGTLPSQRRPQRSMGASISVRLPGKPRGLRPFLAGRG